MEDAIDKYFTPTILDKSPVTQQMCYRSILNYCKILQGEEWPWSELYMDTQRATIHNRIAEYCDCDPNLVTTAIDAVFFPDSPTLSNSVDLTRLAFSKDNFLKNVDKVVENLKEVAMRSHNERYPSNIPDEKIMKLDLSGLDIPTTYRN